MGRRHCRSRRLQLTRKALRRIVGAGWFRTTFSVRTVRLLAGERENLPCADAPPLHFIPAADAPPSLSSESTFRRLCNLDLDLPGLYVEFQPIDLIQACQKMDI